MRGKTIKFEHLVSLLEEYKKEFGDCLVKYGYEIDGIKLGIIVSNIRGGKRKITEEERAILEQIGFVFSVRKLTSFEEVLKLLKAYKAKHNNLMIPSRYVVNDVRLGAIVQNIKKGRRKISYEQRCELERIGFYRYGRNKETPTKEIIRLLKEYYEKHDTHWIPLAYITEDGIRLGEIASNIRSGMRRVDEHERELLNKIGFIWKYESAISFPRVLMALQEYVKQYGDCDVPINYIARDEIALGDIVHKIRRGYRKVNDKQRSELDKLGFVWGKKQSKRVSFDKIFKLLQEYTNEYGHCYVPSWYVSSDGTKIGAIVKRIRNGNRSLTVQQTQMLNDLGFAWDDSGKFKCILKILEEYVKIHGNCRVPAKYIAPNGMKIGSIVASIRAGTKKISEEERKELDRIGFVWRVYNAKISIDELIKFLEEYNEEHGNYNVPQSYVTPDGKKYGGVINNIRTGVRKVSEEEAFRLKKFGIACHIR